MQQKCTALLAGSLQSAIDAFFVQMDTEVNCMTTSLRLRDIIRHLETVQPDVLILCLHNETSDAMGNMKEAQEACARRDIPIILLGNEDQCDYYLNKVHVEPDLKLVRPLKEMVILDRVRHFIRSRMQALQEAEEEREREERARQRKERARQRREDQAQPEPEAEVEVAEAPAPQSEPEVEVVETPEAAPAAPEVEEVPAAEEVPVAEEAPAEEAPAEETPAEPEGEKRKQLILVVDDDNFIQTVIRTMLEDLYEVESANSGMVALHLLESITPDLILLDYEMPRENGAQVMEKLQKNPKTANIPVVFSTGISDSRVVMQLLKLKPDGYLLKPIDKESLISVIEKTLSKHRKKAQEGANS